MDLLLDTHVLIWLLDESPKLSQKAKTLIFDENNHLYISSLSLMEISIKHNKKPDAMQLTGTIVYDTCLKNDIWIMPLKAKHVVTLETLKVKDNEFVNNDPFDKALIAQAKHEKFKLLTHDKAMQHYDEDCICFV